MDSAILKDLQERVEKLNTLFDEDQQWKLTHARKEHEDEFEKPIKNGEYYFRREIEFMENMKLSLESMDIFCKCLFINNSLLFEACEEMLKEKFNERKEEHARYTLMNDLSEPTPKRKKNLRKKGRKK